MRIYLKELYKRKDLLLYLVTTGLKAQHRDSFLGYFWWLLDPFLGVCLYYFIVVVLFHRGGANYGLYLVIGLVVWKWLSVTLSAAARSIVSQAGIITQVSLPKVIFPLSTALTQLINFGFGLCVVGLFCVFFKILPGWEILWLPYITCIQLLFTIAVALVFAYICVFVRDIDNLVTHLTRIWFYGSPVIWYEDMIPERGRWLLVCNPASHFLTGYRRVLMNNVSPDYVALLGIGAVSLLVILSATRFYSRHEHAIIKAL